MEDRSTDTNDINELRILYSREPSFCRSTASAVNPTALGQLRSRTMVHNVTKFLTFVLVQKMDEEAAQELRFEPGRFGGHDLTRIGDSHQLIERGGVHRKGDNKFF